MFAELINIKKSIADQNRITQYVGVFLGKVCHFRESDKAVRVVQANDPTNYVTWWLKPSTACSSLKVKIGDFVLFCFPTLDPKNGIYLDLFGKVYEATDVTQEYVNQQIEASLDAYDIEIKSYIGGLNFTTLSAVQTWVSAQAYTTLSAVQTWVNAQAYTTLSAVQTWVNAQAYVTLNALNTTLGSYSTTSQANLQLSRISHRYQANNFIQGSKGGTITLTEQWIGRHVTIYCLGSPLPGTGGSQDGGSAISISIDGGASANNSRIPVGSQVYFKIATTANINVVGVNGITLSGVLNGAFLLPLRTCWLLEKTAATTWTLVNQNNFDFVPYS